MKLMQMLPDLYFISYLVAAVSLQCLWSMSMALVDIYALSVKRSLRNCRVVSLFTIGDGVREMRPWSITSTASNSLSWYYYGNCVLKIVTLKKVAWTYKREYLNALGHSTCECIFNGLAALVFLPCRDYMNYWTVCFKLFPFRSRDSFVFFFLVEEIHLLN